jgi:hypothetical protein
MRQSSAIFAAIAIAFVVFITMNGHLPKYLKLLGIR